MADDDVTPKAPRKIVIKHRGEGANVGGGAVASVYAQPAAADHTHAARAATTGASTSQNPGGGDEPAKVVSPWEEVQALFVPRRLPFKRRPMPLPEKGKGGRYSKLKQAVKMERLELLPASEPTYVSIDAPVSMYPAKKYCDITGLPAKYTDPKTKLRYAGADTFELIRSLQEPQVQATLALRDAAVRLR